MQPPQLLNDVINVLVLLAPAAAVVCLVLAGVSLRYEGGGITLVLGGGFTKWMFWCVVFLTLQPLLGWFSSFGVGVPLPGGSINSQWLASFQNDMTNFINNFVLGKLVTTLAAYYVLRAILDGAAGEPFLGSVIAALFLLGAQTTLNLLSSWNSGTQYATIDVLNSAWNYLAGTIMPIAAGLAIVAAIFNFVTRRPMVRLVGVALGLLSVSGIWYLVVSKNANQVDIGGRNVGPGWRLGLAPRLIRRTAASTFQRQPMHRLADRPFPSKWPYPPLVLIGSNYTCAFRPPDDDSS